MPDYRQAPDRHRDLYTAARHSVASQMGRTSVGRKPKRMSVTYGQLRDDQDTTPSESPEQERTQCPRITARGCKPNRMTGYVLDLHTIGTSTTGAQLAALCNEYPGFHSYAVLAEETAEVERHKPARGPDGLPVLPDTVKEQLSALLGIAAKMERDYQSVIDAAVVTAPMSWIQSHSRLHTQWKVDLIRLRATIQTTGGTGRGVEQGLRPCRCRRATSTWDRPDTTLRKSSAWAAASAVTPHIGWSNERSRACLASRSECCARSKTSAPRSWRRPPRAPTHRHARRHPTAA